MSEFITDDDRPWCAKPETFTVSEFIPKAERVQNRPSSPNFVPTPITLRSLTYIRIQFQSFFLVIYFLPNFTFFYIFIFPCLPIYRLSIFPGSHYLLSPLFSLPPPLLFSVLFGLKRDGSAPMSTIVTFNNISLRRFLILEPVARVFIYTSDGEGRRLTPCAAINERHYARCQYVIFVKIICVVQCRSAMRT